jgi:hypothetical protein
MRLGHPAVLSQPSGTRTQLGDEASVWVVAKELSKLTASAFYLSLRSPSPSPTPAPSPSQAPGVAELQNQNERKEGRVVLFGTNPRARQARKVSDMCGVIPVVLIGLRDHFETKQLLSLRAKVYYGIALSVLWSRAATSMAPSVAPSVARSKAPFHAKPAGNNRRFNPQSRGGRPEGRGFGPSTG